MKSISRFKILGLLALPVAALAVVALLLSWNLGTAHHAQAQLGSGIELHIGIDTNGDTVDDCSTVGDAKGSCTVAFPGNFVVNSYVDSFAPLANYAGLAVTLTYSAGINAPLASVAAAAVPPQKDMNAFWAPCVFEVTAGGGPGPTFTNIGCTIGISAANSTYIGKIAINTFSCGNADPKTPVPAQKSITMTHGAAATGVIDPALAQHFEAGPDVLNITCAAATATFTPTATSTPPPVPRVFKKPVLQNVFLQRQGNKIPPQRCDDSTDVGLLTEQINIPVSTVGPKGDAQTLAAFEFEVRFDSKSVCVNLIPGAAWSADTNVVCTVHDKDSSTTKGIANIGCVTFGKGNNPANTNLTLATIEVRPSPELYSQIRPNQQNGIPVQILNQGCQLSDEQGDAIPIFSCEDADITFRFLEGDVDGPDCDVDVFDTQQMAFRWGAFKGNLLFNSFLDLSPSGHGVNGDGRIDIGDIQFVFGRFASTCANPWPAQGPVNPKA